MKVDGSCHCGAIAFTADVDPARVGICHCTDCQQLTGTAFRVSVACPEPDFHLIRGVPRMYLKTGDSGRRRQQAFCADCGSHLYAAPDEPPGARTINLRVGVLTQRSEFTPRLQIWTRSMVPWLPPLPGKVFEQNA